MQTVNYLIVDDEPQARKLLQAYMTGLSNYNLVKLCANAMEAYEALHISKIDLVFLDIKMPVVSGTDFLRSLKNPPMVVFTTAYNKYAIEGYELNVIDYLLKPIALPRLLQALEKVQDRLQKPAKEAAHDAIDHLFIKVENKLVRIVLTEVLLIEGMQNYVKLHLKNKVIVATYTMKALEDLLPANRFLRVHRSYIVPLATINAINGNLIETDYRNIPIGLSFKNEIMKYIKTGQ
ncbi:LytR/AlgR family response regulator transcription factor [Mucilaginibacter sp. OK098]|uniref:LytR/AlgR family response regulator transcription factor n=1 Tax=Mucilaginibacter sp. OK098 TaxID=1855297 RepID=UPI00091DD4AC|nr:response regulator transcription factor [Mucilaginibacter sp. OK098]SHN12649.1 two component transcriptional regulator, LytTR family [Mucilaginibacter sp. OK098]